MRSNPIDVARRAFLGFVRGTVYSVDDSTKIQSHSVRGMQNEMLTEVERFQEYGFSSVPMPPDANGGAAEVAMAFVGGNRSHPIIIATDDRRTRPMNWNPGDSGLWHTSGATAKFTTGGQWVHDSLNQYLISDPTKLRHMIGTNGPAVTVKSDMVYLGGDPDIAGVYDFVMTASGPSINVKARIG